MSDTILGGDFTVYYLGENRQKRIKWSGAASGTRTMNELYSALQDHFDESLQMDDGTPMSAETPVEYTIGKIDAGDADPWYIDYVTMQHLTGGSLKTSGWTRATGTNAGIIVVAVTSNNIVAGDVGYDIDGATTGHGTLLEVIDTGGSTDYLIIRPNSSAAGDDFTTDTQTITCNAHTASQSGASSNTGEQIWANLYSIGTIEGDSHIYLYQGIITDAGPSRDRVLKIDDSTQDWWSDGHIDICVPIKEYTDLSVIDGGYISVFIRKYSTSYDFFEVATSTVSGGRNPIPLATSPDLDNITGYKSITFTAASGNWAVGDEIEGQTSGARAIITQIDNPGSNQTLHYYLIDDPLTDFQTAAETVDNNDDTGTGTKNGSAPSDQGPADSNWFTSNTAPTVTFGYTTVDIDDDGTAEGYGVHIDCNANPLDEVYEWIKYIYRRGNTATADGDGIEAEQYVGAEVYLEYTGSVSGGTIDEGDDVLQATTGATGIVISHDTTLKQILLRNTRGTFNTTNTVTSQDNSGVITPDAAADTFAPKKQAPLGTFAGGTFFGARGVRISDWVSGDENNFQLTDSDGNLRERPVAISLEVTNLIGTDETTDDDDRVCIFRLDAGAIEKDEFSAYSGESIGDTTLDVDGAIPNDVPGKTTGGVLRLRDQSDSFKEYRIRYSGWANNGGGGSDGRFTLANIDIASADAGTNTTTIVEAGAFGSAKRGDLVYNHDQSAVSYVKTVDSANQVTIFPAISGQDPGDHIELNCVPIAVLTDDQVYVPLLDKHAAAAQESVSIVYVSTINFRVRVRNVANSTDRIKPFSTDDSTSGTDRSIPTVRTPDTIYTP